MSNFYIIEGPEHCGKSTQAALLAETLRQKYPEREVVLTKEPGSYLDPLCAKVRSIILAPENDIVEKAALFLFLADRAQHMQKVIKPALQRGAIVISDRSSLSTLVYNLASQDKMSEEDLVNYTNHLYQVVDFAQDVAPDICFIASADFDWAKDGLSKRASKDRIEQFDDSFHKRVHMLFNLLECQANEPSKEECLNHTYFANIKNLKCLPKKIVKLPLANHHSTLEIQEAILSNL